MEPTSRSTAYDAKLKELEGKSIAAIEGTDKLRKEVMSRNSKPNNQLECKITKTTASTSIQHEDPQKKKQLSQVNSDSTINKIIPSTSEHNVKLLFCRSTKEKLSSPVSSVNTVKTLMASTSKQHEPLQKKKHSSLVNSNSILNKDLQKMNLPSSVKSVNTVKKSTASTSKQSVVQPTRTSSFDMEQNSDYVKEKKPITHGEMVLLRKPDHFWKEITTRTTKSYTRWICRVANRKIGEMQNNDYPLTTKASVPYKMQIVWEYQRGTIPTSQIELRKRLMFSKYKREKVKTKPSNILFQKKKKKRAKKNTSIRSAYEVGKTIPSTSQKHADLQKKEHSSLVHYNSTDIKRIPSRSEHNIVSPPPSSVNTVEKVIPSTSKQNIVQTTTSSSLNAEGILNQEELKNQISKSCAKKRTLREMVMIEQLKTVWKEIIAQKNKSESISEQHEDPQNKKHSSIISSDDTVSKGIPSRCEHNVDPQKKTLPLPVSFVRIGKKSILSTSKQHEDLQKKSYSSLLNSNSKVPTGMASTCENKVDPQEKKCSSPVNSKNKNVPQKKISSFDIEKNWNYEEVKKRFPDLKVRNRTKRQLAMITQLDYFIEKTMGKIIEPYNFTTSKVLSTKAKASRSNRLTCKYETKASTSNRMTCKVERKESTSKLHEDLQDRKHSSSLSSKHLVDERLPSSWEQNASLLKMKTWSKGPVIPVVKPIQKKYRKINEPEEKPPPVVESKNNKRRFPYLKYSRIRKREIVKRVVLTPSTYEGIFCETVEFGCLPRPNSKTKFFAELEGYRNPNPWRY